MIRVLLLLFIGLCVQAGPAFFVGDLHGDIDALKRILIGLSLIDNFGNWIGADAELITVGDHLDRGKNSRAILDLLRKLEIQAVESGGKVTSLIGNHEFITVKGHQIYATAEDIGRYREFKMGARGNGYDYAFIGNTVYAQWFRARPVIYKTGDTLVVHAGLSEKMLNYSIDEINTLFTAWMKFAQTVGPEPDPSTEWLVSQEGPMWNRNLDYQSDSYKNKKYNQHAMSSQMLDKILSHFGAKRVVIGHSPVAQLEHSVNHPFYGERVISVDTGISEADGKFVTGFKIEKVNETSAVTAFHFDRKIQRLIKTYHSENGSRGNLCLRFY